MIAKRFPMEDPNRPSSSGLLVGRASAPEAAPPALIVPSPASPPLPARPGHDIEQDLTGRRTALQRALAVGVGGVAASVLPKIVYADGANVPLMPTLTTRGGGFLCQNVGPAFEIVDKTDSDLPANYPLFFRFFFTLNGNDHFAVVKKDGTPSAADGWRFIHRTFLYLGVEQWARTHRHSDGRLMYWLRDPYLPARPPTYDSRYGHRPAQPRLRVRNLLNKNGLVMRDWREGYFIGTLFEKEHFTARWQTSDDVWVFGDAHGHVNRSAWALRRWLEVVR